MDGARYLEDGKLTIFTRAGVYYARIRTLASSKYTWRSLKTSNEEAAVQLGRRLLFQFEQRADQGLPPKSKSFSAVIDDYIRYRERDHAHGKTSAGMLRQIKRVSKFWREYAGKLAVEDIDDKVMREFIPWLRIRGKHFSRVLLFLALIPLVVAEFPEIWRPERVAWDKGRMILTFHALRLGLGPAVLDCGFGEVSVALRCAL